MLLTAFTFSRELGLPQELCTSARGNKWRFGEAKFRTQLFAPGRAFGSMMKIAVERNCYTNSGPLTHSRFDFLEFKPISKAQLSIAVTSCRKKC
jgi:hypothetical protein